VIVRNKSSKWQCWAGHLKLVHYRVFQNSSKFSALHNILKICILTKIQHLLFWPLLNHSRILAKFWRKKAGLQPEHALGAKLQFTSLTVTHTIRQHVYCLLCLFQDTHGLRTFSEPSFKAEVDDKSRVGEALMLLADKSQQRQGVRLDTSLTDTVQPCHGSGIVFSVEPGQATACCVNNVDYSRHATVNADFKSDSDVKPSYSAIHSDSLVTHSYAPKAVVDNETTPPMTSVDSRLIHEMPVFDSGRHASWQSGVSGISSSASGIEESPLAGTSSSIPRQHPGQTLTPVNGWSDSTSTPSQHVLKQENDIGQRPGFMDGLGNVNSVHINDISTHKSPNNFSTGVGPSSVLSVERNYPGVGHDNRSWLSSNTSLHSHWNSRVQITEPFWATRAPPFCPQNEGMPSPIHSPPRMGMCQPAAAAAGCGFDGSQMPLSVNGSLNDTTNSMLMSQNVSPSSTPLATLSSKKRVCVSVKLLQYNQN